MITLINRNSEKLATKSTKAQKASMQNGVCHNAVTLQFVPQFDKNGNKKHKRHRKQQMQRKTGIRKSRWEAESDAETPRQRFRATPMKKVLPAVVLHPDATWIRSRLTSTLGFTL